MSLIQRLIGSIIHASLIDGVDGYLNITHKACTGQFLQTKRDSIMNSIIKFVGIIVAIGLLFGAVVANGGLAKYLHINSAIFVIGGAFACGLMAGNLDRFIERAGDGAVCFGWMGTAIGLIAIMDSYSKLSEPMSETTNEFMVALSIAITTVLYGYIVKMLSLAFLAQQQDEDVDA